MKPPQQETRTDRRRRVRSLAGALALVVALGTGCAGSSQPQSLASDAEAKRVRDSGKASLAGAARKDVSEAGDGQAPTGDTGSGSGPAGGTAPVAGPVDPPGPPPADLPWKSKVPVTGTLSSSCVPPGGALTLTVRTKPIAGVAYHAVYADNQGGAIAPYGAGYGGNDKGQTNSAGMYVSAWELAPSTPPGPARVDVIVGWKAKWGYEGVEFHVAAPDGSCK